MSLVFGFKKKKEKHIMLMPKKSVVAPISNVMKKKQNSIISRNGAIITVPRINQLYDEHHSPSNVWYLDLIKAQKRIDTLSSLISRKMPIFLISSTFHLDSSLLFVNLSASQKSV